MAPVRRPPAACCPSAGCLEALLCSVATVTVRFISFGGPGGFWAACTMRGMQLPENFGVKGRLEG